jgi:hypothetical protein
MLGGSAIVHKCSLRLSTADASVRQAISDYGPPPTTTSVDVGGVEIVCYVAHGSLGRSQGHMNDGSRGGRKSHQGLYPSVLPPFN